MSNSFVIRLHRDQWAVSFKLFPFISSFTIGGSGADIRVPDCPDKDVVTFSVKAGGYSLSTGPACSLSPVVSDGETISVQEKTHYYVLDAEGRRLFSLSTAPAENIVPRFDRTIDLPEGTTVSAGAGQDADIMLRHPFCTGNAFKLSRHQDTLSVTPSPGIPLGVYINTRRVTQPAKVKDGDFITCFGFRGCWLHGKLLAPSEDGLSIRTLYYIDEKEQNSHLTYPCINRTSRHIYQRDTKPIELMDPPAKHEKDKNNLLISLMPTAAMIALTVFLRGRFSSDISMILFSTASLAIGAVTSVITYIQTGKEQKKKEAQRVESYKQYIRENERNIQQAREEERAVLNSIYISEERELQNIRDFSADLFDRCMTDDDFLDLRLGSGCFLSERPVVIKSHEVFEPSDELLALPQKLRDKYERIDQLPAFIRLRTANAVGIIGDDDKLRVFLRNIILDLSTRQFFSDVHFYSFLHDSFTSELEAVRLLPHFRSPSQDARCIAFDDDSRTSLLEELYKSLSDRDSVGELPEAFPWFVVFIYADDSEIMHHPIIQYVQSAAKLKTVFIFLTMHRELLPQGCSYTVQMMSNVDMGVIRAMQTDEPDRLFSYRPIERAAMSEAAIRLSPVYSSNISLSARLTSSASLYRMLDANKTDDFDILAAWKTANTAKTLAAPLGILENGEPLMLDLHEKAHGPHGLVAGTTGSGKSQVLISYILSVASRFSPEDVTFAIIDFKGGDIVKHLPNLPHIVGSITNLEKREIARSLKSINAEKNKRMQLFADPAINASNINEYTRAYKEGRARIPLPHLVIIVDEFAELKSQHPDFMQDLISIARVGRSLGIHLILCTQKPAGVVDGQIWSNSDFKLCLRVQTKEDSNEVLKSPLAAEIREPGRGYLQVGRTSTFALFQSGYSGVPENADQQTDTAFQISQLDMAGQRTLLYSYKPAAAVNDYTQREALLARIMDAWHRSGIAEPAQLCMPPLSPELPFEAAAEASYDVLVGRYDDPDAQTMHPLTVDIAASNTAVIGNTQMGKTNLMMAILRQLSLTMTPDDVNVYILDYNSLLLKTMEPLRIIGGVVTADEEEKLKSLLRLLREEIALRKNLFMEAGVTSYPAYRAVRGGLPVILNIIDNYSVFKELYEDRYGDELDFVLREGPSLGITVIATAQQASMLTYRKMFYFGQRIAMPLNDVSEYSSVIEGCRTEPLNTPGRVIISVDKVFYEGQVFEAFDGQTEALKAGAIKRFTEENSGKPRARMIPSVPALLTREYLRENFTFDSARPLYPYGMEYVNVSPVALYLDDAFTLSLVGSDQKAKDRFMGFFMENALAMAEQNRAELYILDDYQRRLREYRDAPSVKKYSTDPSDADAILEYFSETLASRLEAAKETEDGAAEGPVLVLVVNSSDVIKHISDSSLLMDQFNTIADNYRRMRVFFLFSCIANRPVSYSSPDLLRFLREERKALLFEELGTVKTYDIPLMVQRENARPRINNEAFLLDEDDVIRVKLVDQ